MKKIIFTFCRAKKLVYLSHIELEKIFIEAFNSIKNNKISFMYSDESKPRLNIDYALNLPIGMESIGEVAQVYVLDNIKISFFVKAINEVLPEGIAVLSAKYSDNESTLKLYDTVYSATYEIWFLYDEKKFIGKDNRQIEDIKKWYVDKMEEFLNQNKIYILRKNNENVEKLNIKPEISKHSFMINGSLIITIDAGQKSNLMPYDIMKSYEDYIGEYIEYSVRRRKIYLR